MDTVKDVVEGTAKLTVDSKKKGKADKAKSSSAGDSGPLEVFL